MWDKVQYDARAYCCEHFVIDAFKHYKQVDLTDKLLDKSGFFNVKNLKNFKSLAEPVQYCFVMFRASNKAHVGLWVDGKVLHLEPSGVTWQPMDYIKQQFDRVNFYEPIETKS